MTEENKIRAQLFIGCPITPQVRQHLNASLSFREAQTLRSGTIKEVRYKEKEYIGTPLPSSTLPLKEMRDEEKTVLEELQKHCPELDTTELSTIIFPQVFLL